MEPAEIVATWERWDAERSAVKHHVQEIYEYCLPRRATVTRRRPEGEPLHEELYDSTAERAAERFATGLYNFMWNPARANFMLLPPIEHTPSAADAARPLLAVSDRINEEVGRSNFDEAFYEVALDLGTAGSATLEAGPGERSLYEFTPHPFEAVVFAQDRRGRVDTVLRKFAWPAREIVAEFGESACPASIRAAYHSDRLSERDKAFEIVHATVPRTRYGLGARDVRNLPVTSDWVSVTDKHLLRASGWPELRYLVCRLTKGTGEKHGRSCGSTALPDIKMVNRIEETIICAGEQVVRPQILAPDNSFLGTVRLGPGDLLWYRVNTFDPSVKPEPFNSGARVDWGVEYAETKRVIIKQAFYNDLFLILSDDKRRTATEVRSLLAEKLAMLGPNFGRMKVELFDPLIRILLSILGEVPFYLQGLPLAYLRLAQVRYISTLAIAMQYAELGLIQDALLFLSPLAEIQPDVFDHISFDELVRGFLQKMAWPAKWLKSVDEVRALREARSRFQAQQLAVELAREQQGVALPQTRRAEAGSPASAWMEAA